MDKGRVELAMYGTNYVRFIAHGIDPECWDDYRAATEGAKYVLEHRCTLTPIDKAIPIVVRLGRAGFHVMPPERELKDQLRRRTVQEWMDREVLKERIERIDAALFKRTGDRMFAYQRTGSAWLARMISALLADEMGLGKLAPVSEPVLTPTGWSTMGALKVGDYVIGSDGRPTRVVGVYPQGRKRQYKVTLTDGAWTRAGAEHLWYVETANQRFRKSRGVVMTTCALQRAGLHSTPSAGRTKGNSRWFIPAVAPVAFARKKLTLDPYLVGALIANGGLTGDTCMLFCATDQSDEVARVLPARCEVRRHNYKTTSIVSSDGGFMRLYLHPLGLRGRSYEKRVPPIYLTGSIRQREVLLQGLMDNDGTVSRDGMNVEYNTTSPQLARDVLELVRSLGGVAWMSTRIPTYTYKGEKHKGRRDHRIRFSLPSEIVPFRLPRKLALYKPRTKYPPTHAIESIEPDGYEESVCIRVEAEDHLYVTRDYILTHNTLTVLAALPNNVPIIVVCPAVAKGDWRSQIRRWRPQLRMEILEGRKGFRYPKPGELFILNYEILPDIHDREGLKGRVCTGKLPPKPCTGCKKAVHWLGRPGMAGSKMMVSYNAHTDECNENGNMLEPQECPGCHPFLDHCPPGLVVVGDEAHKIKNPKALCTKRFRALASRARDAGGRTWGVTGTPVENEPKELWAIAKAFGAAEEAFGSWQQFVALFKGKKLQYGGYEWGLPGDEIKERLQRFMLRRLRRDVQPQLPSKVWGTIDIELDMKTIRQVDSLIRASGKTVEEIIDLLQNKEIELQSMSSVRQALAVAKIPTMLAVVEDFEEKEEPLVVFSAHRAPIDELRRRPGWVVVTGDESSEEKAAAADAFQNGYVAGPDDRAVTDKSGVARLVDEQGRIIYPRGIGLTIAAGGVSLTLIRAHYQLWVDRAWKPTANAQGEDRTVRLGQTRGTIIQTIVAANHPLDARVTEVLLAKARLIQASVDTAADASDAPLTEADLDAELRAAQEAVAFGGTVRRTPRSEAERGAFEALHTLEFNRADERLATDLAREASDIGLTNAQWALAIKLVARGRLPNASPRGADAADAADASEDAPAGRSTRRGFRGRDTSRSAG